MSLFSFTGWVGQLCSTESSTDSHSLHLITLPTPGVFPHSHIQSWITGTAFYVFIYFNWRTFILQYCDGFSHISTWISHRYTCVPPILNPPPTPLPIPPLQAFPEHQLWVPCFMHWTGPGHLFTYGNVHVLMRFSQIILHCPPTESESLFFMFVSPLMCCMQNHCNWYISVSISLLCEKRKVRNPRASNILSKWCQSCPHLFHSYPIGWNWSCGHTVLQRRVGNVGCSKAAS